VCHPADVKGADGPIDFGAYCWIDFSPMSLSQAKSTSGQNFRVDLRGGAYLTFALRIIPGNTAGANMYARTVPSWTGAAFGNSAFNNIPGSPILYQDVNNQNNPRDTVRLSSITLHANGSTELPFVFVAADGESSNNGESIAFTTTGTAWALVSAPGISNPARNMPILAPATAVGNSTGSQTVNIAGVAAGSGGGVGSYVFTTDNSPGTVTAALEGNGLQGVLFGLKYHTIGLSLTKTHVGDFKVGETGTYTINVANTVVQPQVNPPSTPQPVRVVDTLPAGLTYASAGGTGWSCSNVGQVVTCNTTSLQDLTYTRTFPPLSINVTVDANATSPLVNTAVVSDPTETTLVYNVCETEGNGVCPNSATNTTGDETVVLRSDLSGSTKAVVDVNGGDANPGDTLRYTITLVESAGVAASNVTFTDPRPANTTFGGALHAGTTCTGTDTSTSTLARMTGITVPAGGSCTVVFDVTINAGVTPGAIIDNTATIASTTGTGATPTAPPVMVAQSAIASSGNKVLYVYDNLALTRTPQATSNTNGVSIGNGGNSTWTLTPAIASGKSLVLSAGAVAVSLRIRCTGSFWCGLGNQSTSVQLRRGATVLGTSAAQNVQNEDFASRTFTITLASGQTIAAGETLSIRVLNGGGGWTPQPIAVAQYNGGASTVTFATSTVVNVDSVTLYSAVHPSTATKAQYVQGDTVWIRAVISDPFGGQDVSGARLRLVDAVGTVLVNDVAMTARTAGTGGATRIFEGSYTIPANPRVGTWTAKVTGIEGTELDGSGNPAVTHSRNQAVPVHGRITLAKTWSGATAGNAVALAIAGGSSTTPGTSTAPSTTTPAVASAPASATITLSESFTTGLAGNYSPSLLCTRSKDSVVVPVTGTGLSRTITMPNDSAVACVWSNTWTVPLTVVKLSTVISDPVNGTVNPKAIPGAVVEYQIIVTNPATNPVDADTVFLTDAVSDQLEFWAGDIGGPGPVRFVDGVPASGLSFSAADVAFSDNGGSTWTYVPSGSTTDPAVDAIRVNPKGVFNANNAQFTVRFRARIK
jgi:uncharacterized repeat protein (TIGR01451 family)